MDTIHLPAKKQFLRRIVAPLGLMVGMILLAAGCTQSFSPQTLLNAETDGQFYLTFRPADLDQDGDMDLLVHGMRQPGEFEAYSGGNIWINQGGIQAGETGTFTHRYNDIEGGWSSTTADLEDDGDPDQLIYDGYRLILGINQGGEQGGQVGTFVETITIQPLSEQEARYGEANQFGWLVAGDINNDLRTDAIILGWGPGTTTIEEKSTHPNLSWTWVNQQDAQGRFVERLGSIDALEGLPVAEGVLGDMDGDGNLDLLAVVMKNKDGHGPGPAGLVLLNDGSGTFIDSGQRLAAGESTSVALADVDRDGDLDALIGHTRGAALWINQKGKFLLSDQRITGKQISSVYLADLNNDTFSDALVVGSQQAELWWNGGQGHFVKAGQVIPSTKNWDMALGDFNDDGHLDIFVAGYEGFAQVWFSDGRWSFEPGSPQYAATDPP